MTIFQKHVAGEEPFWLPNANWYKRISKLILNVPVFLNHGSRLKRFKTPANRHAQQMIPTDNLKNVACIKCSDFDKIILATFYAFKVISFPDIILLWPNRSEKLLNYILLFNIFLSSFLYSHSVISQYTCGAFFTTFLSIAYATFNKMSSHHHDAHNCTAMGRLSAAEYATGSVIAGTPVRFMKPLY